MNRKYIAFTFLALFASSAFYAKTKLTIKNTVGGDSDELCDYDFFTNSRSDDISGGTQSESGISLGDRFQLDLENPLFDGRFRLETAFQNFDEESPNFVVAPSGYFHFTPVSQFGIIAGTSFYKHFAIPSAYLAASDDTTKYGRLLTDSLGEERYFGSDNFAVFTNGFAGGITSEWAFGSDCEFYAKAAAGGTFYPDKDEFEKAIDFGVNAGIGNLFDFGFTAHDVTDDDRKFGAFVGFIGNENLVANAGFYYNFTTGDYLPEERVVGSDDDDNDVYKFKKQSTKYALGFSGGYKFEKTGLSLYGDLITGLTNEYIGTIKYYDADGNLIDTKTTTIVRGGTVVKYKNGKAKRTDKYTHEGIPFYAGFRLNYEISPVVEAIFSFNVRTLMNASDTTWLTFYPKAKIDVGERGTIGAGLKFEMNAARTEGLSSFSIPLTYTYKFKKKF